MKLKDIIEKVVNDSSKEDKWGTDSSELLSLFGLHCYEVDYEVFQSAVKTFWIKKWLCTDTYVGYSVIVLNGEPVAVTRQTARKNDKDVFFLSADHASKMHSWLIEQVKTDFDLNCSDPEADWPFDPSAISHLE